MQRRTTKIIIWQQEIIQCTEKNKGDINILVVDRRMRESEGVGLWKKPKTDGSR